MGSSARNRHTSVRVGMSNRRQPYFSVRFIDGIGKDSKEIYYGDKSKGEMIDATEVRGEYRGMGIISGWMKTLQVDEGRKMLGIQWNDGTEYIELEKRGTWSRIWWRGVVKVAICEENDGNGSGR